MKEKGVVHQYSQPPVRDVLLMKERGIVHCVNTLIRGGVGYERERCCSLAFATADGTYTRQGCKHVKRDLLQCQKRPITPMSYCVQSL